MQPDGAFHFLHLPPSPPAPALAEGGGFLMLRLQNPVPPPGFPVLLPIVQQMATLTERRKVLRPVVRPVMIQMRDRQDDPEHPVSAQ